MEYGDIPMGLSMALARKPEALQYFISLDEKSRQAIIDRTHSIKDKKEMRAFVDSLDKPQMI